jgi:hypothetical protein
MMWIATSLGQEDLNFRIEERLRAEEHKRLVKLAKGSREDGGWGSLPRALSAKRAVAKESYAGAFRSLYG